MRKALILAMTAALGAASALANTNPNLNESIDRILSEARAVEHQAEQLSTSLKSRQADLSKATEMSTQLKERVKAVKQLVEEIEPSIAAAHRDVYDSIVLKAKLLEIFVMNKEELLTSAQAAKKRSLIRAKADGIAKRAEMLQQAAIRLKS